MNRYIDLEDFNNNFRGELCKGIDCDTCTFHRGSYFCKLADYINNYQIADIVPVVHAHWVLNKERMVFVCSNCEESPTDGTGHTFDDRMLKERNYKYCRYCGAKMDEVV